jgi:release factor glutamine methyltransferase
VTTPLTPAIALTQARAAGLDRQEAQWLLEALSGWSRARLISQDDQALPAEAAARWPDWLRRRLAGEPLAYLRGGREFHGLWLEVDARVLDPRPDTETLVDWAIELLPGLLAQHHEDEPLRLADLGTGSGAIALALAHWLATSRPTAARARPAEVIAIDRSLDALAVARANGERLGLPVHWLAGHWWQALAGGPARALDLAVSNPPYIRPDDPHLPALRHEPHQALVAGEAGLADLRALIEGAPKWLLPGGWLLLEHGHDQAGPVADLFRQATDGAGNSLWEAISHRADLAGNQRCTGARRVAAGGTGPG